MLHTGSKDVGESFTSVRQWRTLPSPRFGVFALRMVNLETTVFTRQVQALLADEAYRRLQMALAEHPDLGTLIPQGGGLRKFAGACRGEANGVACG